jgi:hypothetical protein
MPNLSTFDKILIEAQKKGLDSKKASDWLWSNLIPKTLSPNKLLKENPANLFNSISPDVIGRMVFYQYDAKYKKVLPYWDRFPLVFIVDVGKGFHYAINLHYLSPFLRSRLLDQLYSLLNNKKFDDSTRLKISYGILKNASKFSAFKPAFKKYLSSHIQSQILYIEPEQWAPAVFLPVARFEKASSIQSVWNDSQSSINTHNQSLPKNSKNRKQQPKPKKKP